MNGTNMRYWLDRARVESIEQAREARAREAQTARDHNSRHEGTTAHDPALPITLGDHKKQQRARRPDGQQTKRDPAREAREAQQRARRPTAGSRLERNRHIVMARRINRRHGQAFAFLDKKQTAIINSRPALAKRDPLLPVPFQIDQLLTMLYKLERRIYDIERANS